MNRILGFFAYLVGSLNQFFIVCSEYWLAILSTILIGLGYLLYRGYTLVDVLLVFINLINWLIGEIVTLARWVIFEKIEIEEKKNDVP